MTTVTEFTSAAISDRGLNESRPQNEDSYVELAQHGFFAVADGVGGAQAGEVASQMAIEILSEAFINIGESDPEDTMRIALTRANEAIYQMSRDLPQLSSMATTIVALHVAGDIGTIAHVGDSRVYRVDPNGRLFRETDDHSVVEEEVRAGRMTPEQALNHPSRNVISRALGAEDTVDPDVKCVLLHPATTFLLCSDGITRHIDDAEIESLLNSDFGPEDICARMKEICFSRGAEDNLTAVVVHFPGERHLPAAAETVDDDVDEQVTLAGIRQAEPSSETAFEPAAAAAEPLDDDEGYLIEVSEPAAPPQTVEQAAPLSAASAEPELAEEVTADPVAARTVSTYDYAIAEHETTSSGGKWLLSLGLFVLGAILGSAGAYYYFTNYSKRVETPVITEQKSNNVPLTSFESTRRLVDEDPVKFLNARAATPQGADDYFWLGRALLLTGKPVEARRAFEEARTKLATFDDRSSARTMANEIALALSVLDSAEATKAFTKEIEASAPASNTNSNSAANSAAPIR